MRDEALGEAPERICWHEWSCEKGVDLDSREAWLQANPALGTRLQLDVIRGERARFSDEGFMRERLGMWPAKGSRKAVISPDLWARQTISEAGAPEESAKVSALGLDMSPDRIIAVSGCWVRGENSHVELLAFDQAADTLGAVRFIAERAGRRIPVVIDGVSPAASMVPALKDLRVKVIVTSAQDMGRACGMFYDDLAAGRITHCSQQQLDDAVTGAGKREIRDAGMWAWDRRSLEVNIAPLVSATLARFGAAVTPRPTGAGRTVGDRSSSGRVGTVS